MATHHQPRVRIRVLRGWHGAMYVAALFAGLYGFFRPQSVIDAVYGPKATYAILTCVSVGAAAGLYSYLTRFILLEIIGIPVLVSGLLVSIPALFWHDAVAQQTAWTGWLCVVLVLALGARWSDVREIRSYAVARSAGAHRRR